MVWTGAETLIKATGLTSSAGVGLGVTNASYSINNNLQIPKPPSTAAEQTVNQVRQDFNNSITFSGVIDTRNATATTGGKISWELLEDIGESQSDVYLNDEIFTAGAWQKVVVLSVKASRANDSKSGHLLTYNLVVVRSA